MRGEDQQQFCARWLDQRGIYDQPTLAQLMDMAEAWAAHRLHARSGSATKRPEAAPGKNATPDRH